MSKEVCLGWRSEKFGFDWTLNAWLESCHLILQAVRSQCVEGENRWLAESKG